MLRFKFTVVFLLAFTTCLFQLTEAVDWNYDEDSPNGPDGWSHTYPSCAGLSQSPINIDSFDMVFDSSLEYFKFNEYKDPVNCTLKNVGGYTVQLTVSDDSRGPRLMGGSLPGNDFRLMQLHFHWGSDESVGSEHTLNGISFPLEMHLVHKRLDRDTNESDALTVIGFFFEISPFDNPALQRLLDNFDDVTLPDLEIPLYNVNLLELLPRSPRQGFLNYVRYPGSLTTPPCYQSVVWSVMLDPLKISSVQLSKFRTLYTRDRKPMQNNFRPVQPLNGRLVTTNLY